MLRATAAPERFLRRGLAARLVAGKTARSRSSARRSKRKPARFEDAVLLPADLVTLLETLGAGRLGDLRPARLSADATFNALVRAARLGSGEPTRARKLSRARLLALFAGAVPFGASPGGALWVYALADARSPARGVVGRLPGVVKPARATPALVCRGAGTLAVRLALEEAARERALVTRAAEGLARLPAPGAVEEEAVRAAFARAAHVLDLVVGDDAAVRRAARHLVDRPLDVPPPPDGPRAGGSGVALAARRRSEGRSRGEGRPEPLALGPVVEAFFRAETGDAELAFAHASSRDALVRDAVAVLVDAAKETPRTALGKDLARRRALAARAVHARAGKASPTREVRIELTKRIVQRIDELRPVPDPGMPTAAREEALLALGELGDGAVLPSLVARAVTGDVAAVDMLGAFGDARAVPHLLDLLRKEPGAGLRVLECAAVRALTDLRAHEAAPVMRDLLERNPLTGWREGMERGALVRELTGALGTLRDQPAAPLLVGILESNGNEYKSVAPVAAWAAGRLRHGGALPALERLVLSPKEAPSAEAVWAIGEIGAASEDPWLRGRAAGVLAEMGRAPGLELGVEVVRLTGLAKIHAGTPQRPAAAEVRRALEQALWEPAFRQPDTSRRQAWAFRSLAELAKVWRGAVPEEDDAFFLGHEAVRYFVTRDDHRVRTSAQAAFAAWGVPLPRTRRYYAFLLDAIEERGGLEALHDAVRDPLGVFRHNVATRLAERGAPSSVRPLAEAAARLFAEPATSTYEYDDAPLHVVTFVRALATLNRPEGNAVLIEALRSAHHHVRAVVADNAPADPAFVPELMAMLGDPRSFLRSRADRALRALGAPASLASTGENPVRVVEL